MTTMTALTTPYGTHLDGTPALWTWANTLGSYHGLVIGGTGSGKTHLLSLLAADARRKGLQVWNVSSDVWNDPALEAAAHRTMTGAQTLDALTARARTTDPEHVVVIVDEADAAVTAADLTRWETLARGSARTSMVFSVLGPVRSTVLSSRALHQTLELANVVALPSLDSPKARTFRGLPANPATLPREPGAALAAFGGKATNPTPLRVKFLYN